MCIDDEEKTVFVTPFSVYYYKMLFGLNNASSTYQECVCIVLKGQTGHNMEAYIDDIVVKSKFKGDFDR
jgi:hypothetical protein